MGNFFAGNLMNVLLATVDVTTASDTAVDTDAEDVANIEIHGNQCYFNEKIASIQERAKRLLGFGIKWGFGAFPIKKGSFKDGIVSTHVTEENICNALLSKPNVNESNHNKKRNKIKSKRVMPEKAWDMGVSADRIEVKKACPEDYDWENSPVYSDIESCDDVWEEINGYGVPALLYVVDMEAAAARTYIDSISTAELYSKYSKDPAKCGSGKEYGSGKKFKDTYNDFPIVDFIIRSYWGKLWSAWNHRESCEGYASDELKFNFGTRVFVPITVDEGNGPVAKTIVISSIAAAPNLLAADLFGWMVPEDMPYERFVGGETAKKILIDAKAWGWNVE